MVLSASLKITLHSLIIISERNRRMMIRFEKSIYRCIIETDPSQIACMPIWTNFDFGSRLKGGRYGNVNRSRTLCRKRDNSLDCFFTMTSVNIMTQIVFLWNEFSLSPGARSSPDEHFELPPLSQQRIGRNIGGLMGPDSGGHRSGDDRA
jgi:hypothetical protein